MAFKESRVRAGTEPEETPADDSALSRVNTFGEKHARAIITISTVLVIAIVVIVSIVQREKADVERAQRELAAAVTLEDLKQLKEKYGKTPVGPQIAYRLATRYYEENSLAEADAEYRAFRETWPNDPLLPFVLEAQASLLENQKFEREKKALLLKQHYLQTHPRRIPGSGDPLLRSDPPPHAGSEVQITLPNGAVHVRLFEDEAPATAAHFLEQVDAETFNGLKVAVSGDGARFEVVARDGAEKRTIPREKTSRPAEEGALVMIPSGDANEAGRFQVLLKDHPDLEGVTVFGTVTHGLPSLKAAPENAAIGQVRVPYRRP